MAWGTNAGYAINPARDFGPRLASFITGYGGAWRDQYGNLYFWVPIIGPLIGGLLGAGLYKVFVGRFLPTAEPEPPGRVPTPEALTGPRAAATRVRPHRQRRHAMADFVGAVDQGTTSTRFMIFDHDGNEVAKHQLEHAQILPRSGWVEHDPVEIWERTNSVIQNALRHGEPVPGRPGGDRHHQPAGDHRRLGPAQRPSLLQRHRLAGHPHRLHRRRPGTLGPGRRHPPQGGAAAGHLLLRRQDPVDPGERRRRPRGGRSRATPSSATRTPGCCGTSPAAPTAASTPPTSPTPAAPC